MDVCLGADRCCIPGRLFLLVFLVDAICLDICLVCRDVAIGRVVKEE